MNATTTFFSRLVGHRNESSIPASKRDRFKARLHKTTEEFELARTGSRASAAKAQLESVGRSLATAREILASGDLDGAWGALHDAERTLVYSLDKEALLGRAGSVQAECKEKLRDWRREATEGNFARAKLAELRKPGREISDEERDRLAHAVFESLNVLNEHTDNVYHRMRLVGEQLRWLVLICCGALLLITLLAWSGSLGGAAKLDDFSVFPISAVMLAGALGGCASAMYQLSRVGKVKVPEEALHGLITTGRPVVGAAVALFIYAVVCAGFISLEPAGVTNHVNAGILFGFVAGFSERFVMGVIGKAAKDKDEDKDKAGTAGTADAG